MYASALTRLFAAWSLIVALAIPALAQDIPRPSGLPWASGVTKPNDFGTWRGRPLDVRTVYGSLKTWELMRTSFNGSPSPAGVRQVIGLGMLPESHRGQLPQCGGGAFDVQITAIRDNMLLRGWKGSLIRLGWEANRAAVAASRSTFPWAAQGDGSSYVACFRRWADILNPITDATTTPPTRTVNFPLVWNMANAGTFPAPIEQMYPGDDVVAYVGSQFYDRCPPITTEAEWLKRVGAKDRYGNPAGPVAWLYWARSRGKKWSMPEWGIGGSQAICAQPGFDNPFFIRRVHAFLRYRAPDVAFESYFNGVDYPSGSTFLYPGSDNPRAAAEYRRLW